jgi:RNA polymerase II elongation factor ELL
MRFALIHLLAVRPLSEQDIHQKTHIPKAQLSSLLPKIADKQGLTWELSNKPYKELDPWSFKYTSDQRTLAIDHAIRAFDRARIPKEDKVWQILLPKEERNKGKILSRLHLTTERPDQAGTPGLASTPLHTSAAATPNLGGTGTPRGGSGTTATGRSAAGISIEKRLKEAKKKGAMEKKKQEKEAKEAAAAASDRESKPRNVTARRPIPPKKVASKVKSDEVVHSSDDEEEGEVKEDSTLRKSAGPKKEPSKLVSRAVVTERRDSSASEAPVPHKDNKTNPKPSTSDKLAASTVTRKDSAISKAKTEAPLLQKNAALPKKPESAIAASVATKPKDSPALKSVRPASTTQRPNISPRRVTDTKPKVPSPLGTSPPRNASGHGEKPIKQPPKPSAAANATNSVRPTPAAKGSEPLSFFGGVKTGSQSKIVTKKRPLESDTESVEPARKVVKSTTSTPAKTSASAPVKPHVVNGTGKQTVTKAPPASSALKRKANDLSSGLHDHAAPPSSKHRKTDSGSTHSHTATSSSVASLTTAPTVSPHSSPAGSDFSDENLAGILNDEYEAGTITWEQTRAAAETFRSKLYPEYLKLYRRIEQTPSDKVAKEDTVRLWQLHNRLEAMKHRIEIACRDEGKGGI